MELGAGAACAEVRADALCEVPHDYSASSRNGRLGSGITLAAGEADAARPVYLVDHNVLSPSEDVIELVYADGGSDFYDHLGSSRSYVREAMETVAAGDGSLLTKNPGGVPEWTLVDSGGMTATFGSADSTTGRALVHAIQVQAAGAAPAQLSYAYAAAPNADLLTKITDASGREVDLDWNALDSAACPNAILCVTGPDGITWRYIGTSVSGGTATPLEKVNNGTRDILKLEWTSDRVSAISGTRTISTQRTRASRPGTTAPTSWR